MQPTSNSVQHDPISSPTENRNPGAPRSSSSAKRIALTNQIVTGSSTCGYISVSETVSPPTPESVAHATATKQNTDEMIKIGADNKGNKVLVASNGMMLPIPKVKQYTLPPLPIKTTPPARHVEPTPSPQVSSKPAPQNLPIVEESTAKPKENNSNPLMIHDKPEARLQTGISQTVKNEHEITYLESTQNSINELVDFPELTDLPYAQLNDHSTELAPQSIKLDPPSIKLDPPSVKLDPPSLNEDLDTEDDSLFDEDVFAELPDDDLPTNQSKDNGSTPMEIDDNEEASDFEDLTFSEGTSNHSVKDPDAMQLDFKETLTPPQILDALNKIKDEATQLKKDIDAIHASMVKKTKKISGHHMNFTQLPKHVLVKAQEKVYIEMGERYAHLEKKIAKCEKTLGRYRSKSIDPDLKQDIKQKLTQIKQILSDSETSIRNQAIFLGSTKVAQMLERLVRLLHEINELISIMNNIR